MFKSVLIANRGEIAVRAFRAAYESDATLFMLPARAASVLFDLGTVALVFAAVRRWFNRDAALLAALSPYGVLERGYAIVTGPDGRVLRSTRGRRPADRRRAHPPSRRR